MNENRIAFRVGVVVVAAAGLAALLIAILGGGRQVLRGSYKVVLRFPTAPGVREQTPVRKNGILIGRITDVELGDRHVDLTARIDKDRKLSRNEVPRVKTASFLGDSVVEFVPANVPSQEFIQDGDLLANGVVATDPLEVLTNLEGNMQEAIVSIKVAADEFTTLSRSLNQTLGTNDQQLQRMLTKTETALDSFNRAMTTFDDVLGDPQLKQDLKQALSDVPELFNDVRTTMSGARDAMAAFERVGQKAERNLDNLEEFTGPLGEVGDQLIQDISRSVENLEELSSQLVVFSEALNSPDGTLGRLINDDTLYRDIRETVENVNEASRKIRPILNDVRVLTDKMSTDPGVILRGALRPNPSRKWPDTGIPLSPTRRQHETTPDGRRW
jgi:phospholipid/cholesterol/gamma-HCH transport system substrate-binding protein